MNKPLVSFKHVYCRINGFILALLVARGCLALARYNVYIACRLKGLLWKLCFALAEQQRILPCQLT